MSEEIKYTSSYTGQEINSAVSTALKQPSQNSAFDSKITALEKEVAINTNSIDAAIQSANEALSTVNKLNTRVGSAEKDIRNNTSDINILDKNVKNINENLNASVTAISEAEKKVGINTSDIKNINKNIEEIKKDIKNIQDVSAGNIDQTIGVIKTDIQTLKDNKASKSELNKISSDLNTVKIDLQSKASSTDLTNIQNRVSTLEKNSSSSGVLNFNNQAISSTVGGLSKGTTLGTITTQALFNKIFFPYVAPSISVSGFGTTSLPQGSTYTLSSITVTLNLGSTTKSKIIKISVTCGGETYYNSTGDWGGGNSTINFTQTLEITNAATITVNIMYDQELEDGSIKSSVIKEITQKISFYYPNYYGIITHNEYINKQLTTSSLTALSSNNIYKVTYSGSSINGHIVFASKKSDITTFTTKDNMVYNNISKCGVTINGYDYYLYMLDTELIDASTIEGTWS